MYRIFFVNNGYFSHREFNNADDAKAYQKKTGFQSALYFCDEVIGFYCPMNGFRNCER